MPLLMIGIGKCGPRHQLMTFRIIFSTLLAAAVLAHGTKAMAQSSDAPASDRVRIERLADLGRLWGYIKFAHPVFAYTDIDWDLALVRALPQVRAARSTEEYVAAINGMLSILNDPLTRAAKIRPLQAEGARERTAIPRPASTPI